MIQKGWNEFITNEEGQYIFVDNSTAHPPNEGIYDLIVSRPGDYSLRIALLDSSGGRYGCVMMLPYHTSFFAQVIVFSKLSPIWM